jgi:hypothetical protein
VIASKARYGPIPLRLAYLGGLRGIGPALAEEARGRIGLSRCARGALVIASKARYGPIPLRLAYLGGLRGIGPALAEEARGRIGLSRCALRVFGDRFQALATDRSRCRFVGWVGIGDRLPEWSRGIGIGAGGQLRMNWACIRA